MYVQISPGHESGSPVTATLCDTDVFTELYVSRGAHSADVVARALQDSQLGTCDGDEHAWLSIEALRRSGSPGPTWTDGFEGMLAYAQRHGWVDEARAAVRAHLLDARGPATPPCSGTETR
jgi:hypothetical protein